MLSTYGVFVKSSVILNSNLMRRARNSDRFSKTASHIMSIIIRLSFAVFTEC